MCDDFDVKELCFLLSDALQILGVTFGGASVNCRLIKLHDSKEK